MILFDLSKTQPRGESKYHGGGKYGVVVFNKIATKYPQSIMAYYDDEKFIDNSVINCIQNNNIQVYHKSEYKSIDELANKQNCVIYSPLYGDDYRNANKAIVTIHGLRTLEMPYDAFEHCFPDKRSIFQNILMHMGLEPVREHILRQWYHPKHILQERQKCNRSNIEYVTVSNHSKSSLLNFIPTLQEKDIQVFYSPSTIDDSISTDSYTNQYGKYYMIVSGNRWLKNPARAIIAFDQLFSERTDLEFRVVITGLTALNALNLKITHKDRFICLDYVDEWTLKCLYHNAYALVYPSLNEGFGYPPLEAMHEGCPVIASAIASIPEVCGESVLYFNPYLIDEIKMRIIQMEDIHIHKKYQELGKKREHEIRQKQDNDLDLLCNYLLEQSTKI